MRLWLLPLALLSCFCLAETPTQPLAPDVRMIIDISGSMKKTDPQNLRRPAIDLMVRLLPEQSRAGIWTFGQSVNMLVPFRAVDASWRKQAIAAAPTINSVALYTNIGAALEKATVDANHLDSAFRHNLVLLTDGVVDIGPDVQKNTDERRRILTEVLPRLKRAGYVVHTIALSDAADQQLLRQMSEATDGIFALARSADDLMSTFVRIFDQAVPAERLPLDEQGFLVDASVKEFTALIFRKTEGTPSVLLAPDGHEFSDSDASQHLSWYKTASYDLITVQQPATGRWQVKTEMAPNSRVTVVSNLQLRVAPPKANVRLGQPLNFNFSFSENDQTITKPEFLQLLTASARISGGDMAAPQVQDVTPAQVPADGIFQAQLPGLIQSGDYDLQMEIDGKTFKREYLHHLHVVDALFTLDKRFEPEPQPTYYYRLTPVPDTLDLQSVQVDALISNSGSGDMTRSLNLQGDHWEFSFAPVKAGKYAVTLKAAGKTLDGDPVEEIYPAETFYFPDQASVEAAAHSAAQPQDKAASQPATEPEHPDEAEHTVESAQNHTWLYVALGVANLLLLIVGFFIYRMIAGAKNQTEMADIEAALAAKPGQAKSMSTPSPAADVIDIAAEEQAGLTLEELSLPASAADEEEQKLTDNLFPLDNLQDPGDKT